MRDYVIRPHIEGHDLVYGEEFRIPLGLYRFMRRNGVSSMHAEENLISCTGAYITVSASLLGGDYSFSPEPFKRFIDCSSLDPEEVPRALIQEHHPLRKLILQWRLLI